MHSAQQLVTDSIAKLNARQSENNSPTRTTPAGQTAGGRKTPPRDQTLALVNQVFTRLEAIFPRTWASAFPNTDLLKLARRELALEMAKWPVLPGCQVVERAMSELKGQGSAWPPTIPVLVNLLAPTPEDFGMPGTGEAWREVLAHAHAPSAHCWTHAAVRMAGQMTGWWDLTHTTAASAWPKLEKRFAKHYASLVNRVMAGEDLTPRQLLEHDGSRTCAELAERKGREHAQQLAADAGLPYRMNGDQGLRSLRAALKGA